MCKERNFTVHEPNNGRIKIKELTGIVSYTDGSLLNNKTGCGVHTVLGERVIYNGNFYLGNTATVFQAEVTAIRKSAEMLLRSGWENQIITLEFLISIAPQINVPPGKLGRNNKHTPLK